ncbi:surfeit locus protein 6-domain-containing protein [Dactylonectria estremocensis]|uniref:Surfeit locus protein 6-domain-containing protein n=1 Tax=Dactylonectria estremocensis TaxID=1079267 RepID=A0A9P9F689_9HYPO|nr:surfeit locus protein 6-domain-containing protein [Dactylonectria estremocensis]
MEASLQDRLRAHSAAFDGLLSLIPAKMYYGEDTTNQWNKKKQSKKEAAAARRGKLDPDSDLNRNAKEVMDERAKNKRKLREIEDEETPTAPENEEDWEDYEPVKGVEAEKPGEGLKLAVPEANKKQKFSTEDSNSEPQTTEEATASKHSKKEEKRAAKEKKKKEKKEKMAERNADKKTTKSEEPEAEQEDIPAPAPKSKKQAAKKQAKAIAAPTSQPEDVDMEETVAARDDVQRMDLSGLAKDDENSSPDSEPHSPTFDTNDSSSAPADALGESASATTSVSSTIPPSEKPKHIKLPADTSALRARLAAKIEALRAARKADGPDGKPIRTRQELIESRRRKQALRKANKQEMRKQAKLEEDQKREEALASTSPAVMSPAVELDEKSSNFAFGRVAFGDGAQLSHDLSYVLSQGKKKGPSDPKTALIKVQNQKKRLEELDTEKREDIAEKDLWLTARRRAQGERIHDDEALLKRAVKRKEVAKRKSEKAWNDRTDGIKMAQKERQRKREDNLKARRDDKLLHKAGKGKKKKTGGAKPKKKGRPGFEGSLGVGGRKK